MDGERGESTDNDECESEETRLETRTWINAQRDGRPAEYRWRHLFNAAKLG